MSCALIGCLVGAMASGQLGDRFGRKPSLILAAALFAGTSLGIATAGTFYQFVIWRILGGVAIGLASNISPMYIAEIAPARLRGRLVALNQLTIVIGVLLAQIVNWWIARPVPSGASVSEMLVSWNGQIGWRWMFGVTAVPAVFFFGGMLIVPESPRWLIRAGRLPEARRIWERIGGAPAEAEFIAMAIPVPAANAGLRGLAEPGLRRILALGCFLAFFQQWCGINSVFNYAEEIFRSAGYAVSDTLFNIVITGAVLLLFTVLAMVCVDRLGRRRLMLAGAAGLAVTYGCLGLSYAFQLKGYWVLALVLVAIAWYALTLAPITWVLLSEIFPNRVRGTGMAISVFSLWTGCFTLTYAFPFLNASLGAAGTFWMYGAICLLGWGGILRWLPETRNQPLEEIEMKFGASLAPD